MARIRTIKPEFWQNETMASLPEHARLLAIALLNHADDEGYFLANVALVRAACFPFDEHSGSTTGSLQELSRIGYIEVRRCDGKQIGRVCKFTDHQRIEKSSKSKLKLIFERFHEENNDSGNPPVVLPESSWSGRPLEQGTGNREQGNGTGEKEQGTVSLSLENPNDGVTELFDFWNNHHGTIKTRKATADRVAKAKTRLADKDWPWRDAILKLPLPESPDGGNWQPDIDWLLKNEKNAYSLAEGKFDWRNGNAKDDNDPRGNLAFRERILGELKNGQKRDDSERADNLW